MKRRTLFAAILLLTTAHSLGHDAKGPHGGRIADAGPLHVELVAKDTVVDVYLTNSADKPVSATGYKAIAIIAVRGKSLRVELEPAGDNRLTGKATDPVLHNPRGAVRLTGPDGKTNQAKFD
jgi:hypothetical protein